METNNNETLNENNKPSKKFDITNIDYHKYDILNIYAKKDKADDIIKCYESFKWELIHNDKNEKYSDANALTFVRPHKIKDKDNLQYNQIEMENILNDIGKCENHKHSRSTTWGLSLSLPIAMLIILFIGLYLKNTISITTTCISVIALIILAILSSIFISKVYKAENENYTLRQKYLHERLIKICKKAKEKNEEER